MGTVALLAFSLLSLSPSPWLSAAVPPASPRAQIPAEQAGWVGEPRAADVLFLGLMRLPGSVSRFYSRGDETVTLFAATAAGADRTTSPFSPKTVLPGMRWRLERSDLGRLEALGILVEAAVVVRDGRRWLVYHWRRGDAGLVTETLRHALALDETPQGGRRQRDILRLATPVGTGSSAELVRGADTLERFARDFRDFLSDPFRAPV